jgi:deazaflavin-dependent oxidoreductase (nitroreductase family)
MTIKPFKMSRGMRYGTSFLKGMLRLSIPMGPIKLLTHRGRKSGNDYSTPVAILKSDGNRWLVAAFGEVNWVHNVRAAGGAKLKGGLRTETIHVTELDHQSAAPILKQFLKKFGMVPFMKPYFNVTADAPLTDFEREAQNHAVFRIANEG